MRRTVCLVALCVVALSVAVLAASPAPELSERTRAVLAFDHEYVKAANNASSNMLQKGGKTMTTTYDYDTATKLFWHSVTAYCTDDPSLQDWSCTSCKQFGSFKLTAIMDDTANQGYVGYFTQGLPKTPIPGSIIGANEPFVVVSFRGTVPKDLKDWIEDLSFSKQAVFSSKYPSVAVHSGFWGAYQDMKPKMMAGLATAFSDSGARALIVTGHSLGAAMAELAALDLKLNEYPDKIYASYTQGTPRPGNPAFAALYAQSIAASFREIHQADCVPHLPPMVLGFQHGPVEVFFNEAFSKYQVCSGNNGEDPSCSDSLLMPVSIPDHLTYHGIDVGAYCSSSAKVNVPKAVQVKKL